MQNLTRIEVFLEVARRQSFAAAAKAMGITGPAASKQVMALEAALGVKLLHRTTRLVSLTDEGTLYAERARVALDELKEAAEEVQEMKSAPKGPLRISVPLSFGHMHLLPALSGFAKKYPALTLDVSLEDRMADVLADGFDLVIRIGASVDSSLIARPLGECPMLLVASPGYLKAHGTPEQPADLKAHRMILYTHHSANVEWRYVDKAGKPGVVRHEAAFKANTAEMMLQAALDGVGIVLLPIFSVASYLQAGQLVHVLPECESTPRRAITALMPPNRYRSTKVKLLLEWLVSACRTLPLPGNAGI